MERVLTTGGAGSIGGELSRRLSEEGFKVRILDLPIANFDSLGGISGLEIATGDITKEDDLKKALAGVDTVVHLAAVLPPESEADQEKTFVVNIDATKKIVDILKPGASTHIVFASSVATYGDTSGENPPITTSHPQKPVSIYARSKIEAEKIICSSGCPYTILRISGISIPAFLEPPEVWPFTPSQRMEFINRMDVVNALFQSIIRNEAKETVLNIAGGNSWQMRGEEYVRAIYEVMGVSPEEANYKDTPGPFDWYDTTVSQRLLGYQDTPFSQFLKLLRQAVETFM